MSARIGISLGYSAGELVVIVPDRGTASRQRSGIAFEPVDNQLSA